MTTAILEDLAQSDPVVAPLALLQAEALRAAAEPSWRAAAPAFVHSPAEQGWPLLHGQTLALDAEAPGALLARLVDVAAARGIEGAPAMRRALSSRLLDGLDVLEASITFDASGVARQAEAATVDAALLGTLGQIATIPLLQACGQQAQQLLVGAPWEAGYCPICAAWPTLAELRGLERRVWLRCGRCASGWPFAHQRCTFCGQDDHRRLAYLAPEDDRETARAVVCEACGGYVKMVTTIGALAPAEVLLKDMATLELDVAAVDRGYARPQTPGYRLELRLIAA